MNSSSFTFQRILTILSLCIVTPLGFLCKQYHGWSNWFYLYGGGVLYEIFWCLVFFLFWPKKKNIITIAVAVLLVTCLLEILQLWHPPFLEAIRSTFPGKALIGTTFVWRDFPHYILGSFLGWLLMLSLGKSSRPRA